MDSTYQSGSGKYHKDYYAFFRRNAILWRYRRKPCLVEETPMEANEQVKSAFLRSILFNNWANDCHGLLWWCAYDQNALDFTPYEWMAVERDLGLFRTDDVDGALALINEIRTRSNATELTSLTIKDIEDERARELIWEGYKRRDMIRFGSFFTDTWLGKTTTTEEWRGIFPYLKNRLLPIQI